MVAENEAHRAQFPLMNALGQIGAQSDHLPMKVAFVYLQRLESLGISAVKGDFKRLTKAIAAGIDSKSIRIPISTRRIRVTGLTPVEVAEVLSKPIAQEEIEATDQAYTAAMSATITNVMQAVARDHVRHLKREGRVALKEHRVVREAFQSEIQSIWGGALDKFEMLVSIAREVGNAVIDAIGHSMSEEIRFRSEALALLYGRACQTANEILVLLSAGFPDGAHARWRSLHEINVVMQLIGDGDEDVAERYLEHYGIDLFNEAKSAIEHGGNRLTAIQPSEFAEIATARDALILRYGENFGAPYGWASHLLGKKANSFSDLEKLAAADYIRPFYKSASANVHASARGTLFRLGQPPDMGDLVTGASTYGLARPAVGAAHSLTLSAVTFAQASESPDAMAYAMAMSKFAESASKEFERIEQTKKR